MNYLIDTCVLSKLMKPVPNQQVLGWFDSVNESSLFVSWNLRAADVWAQIYADGEAVGHCPSLQDSIIAATALAHGMTMVTRNVDDFQFEGLTVINPFVKEAT